MSDKKEQVVPIPKHTRPSKPPTKKKTEGTQTSGGNNAVAILKEMEEVKELSPLSLIIPTPTEKVLEQGDPLSPYLFKIVVEILAIAIRQNKAIKGINLGNEETKLLQFAEDTTAVLTDTDSAVKLFEILNSFEIISGLKINCSKTEGMWTGSLRNHKAKPFGIKWPDEPIKALGVYFTYNQELLKEKNFIERLDSVTEKLINIWSSRGLSIYGKVTIIKSFLIPKFVYACSVLPTPKELIKQLNKLLFKFLWKGTDKVKRVSVINEYEKGGLRMIDLECMVKS